MTIEKLVEVGTLYRNGAEVEEIAQKVGYSVSSVQLAIGQLRKAGAKNLSRITRKSQNIKEAVKLLNQ